MTRPARASRSRALALTMITGALMLAGCAAEPEAPPTERYVDPQDGFSVEVPAGWTSTRDRGAVIFTPGADSRRTLVVRAVPREPSTPARKVLRATRTVVRGLPGAEVQRERSLDGDVPGVSFSLTFVPPGFDRRYARTHTVVVGDEHVFHVIDTAPAGEQRDDRVVEVAVASLREEV